VKTTIFVCPFALFGNPGTQRGAELLADAVREMLDDNRHERRPTRAGAYQDHVKLKELRLDTPADYSEWHAAARQAAKTALDAGEFLIWIGGNHLSVMPLYEELGNRTRSLVVQFDAHLDIYHHDDTKQDLSHGNFIRHLPDPKPEILNLGHRDQFLSTKEIHEHFAAAVDAVALLNDGVEKKLANGIRRANRVCLDIDWDVLDPAYFPAVDDPLPFGLTPQQLLRHMQATWSDKTCAVAMSEFHPARDDGDRSLQLAVWLIEQMLLWKYES
jgi:agmatinase